MGPFRNGPGDSVDDLELPSSARRLSRMVGGATAIGGAPFVDSGLTLAAVAAVVAAAGVLGHRLGRGPPLGRRGELAGAIFPIVGATVLSLPAALVLLDPPIGGVTLGILCHGVLVVFGIRFALQTARRAPVRELARTALTGALSSLVTLILLFAARVGAVPGDGAAGLAGVPLTVIAAAGLPHVPILWCLLAARIRGERFATASGDLTDPSVELAVPSATMRRLFVARSGRIVGASLLLAGAVGGILHAAFAYADGTAAAPVLTVWALLTPIAGALGLAFARVRAALRFDAVAARSGEGAGVRMARGLERASFTVPLAAWLFVLPSAACGLVTFLVGEGPVQIDLEAFLRVSLLGFFPSHLFVIVLALDLGWPACIRAARIVVTWVLGLVTAVIWADVLRMPPAVTMILFAGTLLCLPPLFSAMTLVIERERALTRASSAPPRDPEAARPRGRAPAPFAGGAAPGARHGGSAP